MGGAGVESRAADAFGAERSSVWRRLRGGDAATPRRVAGIVGFLSALVVWVESEAFHGFAGKLVGLAVLLVPAIAVERSYKARRRRKQERLLPPL
jgi:hypothetical protein